MGLPLYAVVVLLFAVWVTVHTLLCLRIARRRAWAGVVGLLLPPLAIYYAQRYQVGALAPLWVASLSFYLVALTAGFIG